MKRGPTVNALFALLLSLGGWTVCAYGEMIPATEPEVVNSLSALNWVVKEKSISSATGGASFALAFSGTRRVALRVDTSALEKLEPSRYPVVAWSVNGADRQSHQLLPAETTIVLANDVPDPRIDFYLQGFSPFEDRYNGDHPVNSVRITAFEVADGAHAVALPKPPKLWLNVGDSIMAGDAALEKGGQGRPADGAWAASSDARASYGYLLAQHFGYAESRLAYGGYDYSGGLANVPALTILLDQMTSTVSRLHEGKFQPAPEVVLINLGENGAPTAAAVIDALTKLRLRVGSVAKIIVMVPLSGRGRSEVTAAVNAYCNSSHDGALALVDLGSIRYETADGQHPTAGGQRAIYDRAVAAMAAIVH